jgi:hypothetical protein
MYFLIGNFFNSRFSVCLNNSEEIWQDRMLNPFHTLSQHHFLVKIRAFLFLLWFYLLPQPFFQYVLCEVSLNTQLLAVSDYKLLHCIRLEINGGVDNVVGAAVVPDELEVINDLLHGRILLCLDLPLNGR